MRTARWIWRTRRSSEWPSETASGGSSQWTATISLSIAFTDESALQLSRRSIEERLAAATARRWHQRSTSPAAQPRGARERALGLDGQLAQQVLFETFMRYAQLSDWSPTVQTQGSRASRSNSATNSERIVLDGTVSPSLSLPTFGPIYTASQVSNLLDQKSRSEDFYCPSSSSNTSRSQFPFRRPSDRTDH